jgi:hypothetical protein
VLEEGQVWRNVWRVHKEGDLECLRMDMFGEMVRKRETTKEGTRRDR